MFIFSWLSSIRQWFALVEPHWRRKVSRRRCRAGGLAEIALLEDRVLLSGITQITDTTSTRPLAASINDDGTRFAIGSRRDLTGNNADENSEIFLFETNTNTLTQITNTQGGLTANAVISGDGTKIAFRSSHDLVGVTDNIEIFLFDISTSNFTQVTDTDRLRFELFQLPESISNDGGRIVFNSNHDLAGNNSEGKFEIFLFDAASNGFTQITETTGNLASREPSLNGDGTKIVFESFADLTGNNDDNNSEIFLFETTTNVVTQITVSEGFGAGPFEVRNADATISTDGTKILFNSDADLTGNNSDKNRELFLFDTATSTFTQITDTTSGLISGLRGYSINADGTKIAFGHTSDLTGNNPDASTEIFLFDTTTNATTQLTDSGTRDSSGPQISSDGTKIAFFSDADFTGNNPDGNRELFLLDTTAAAWDFGDAPDSYGTTLANGGAQHVGFGVRLGDTRDCEEDAQGPLDGTGDDVTDSGSADDEDGVRFSHLGRFDAGETGQATVDVQSSSGDARLYAWVDFDGNGSFADAGEQIADGTGQFANLGIGLLQFQFAVPDTGFRGTTFTRFRISTDEGLSFDGLASDGEVEDYAVEIVDAITSPALDLAGFEGGNDEFVGARTAGQFPGSLGPTEEIANLPGDRSFRFGSVLSGDFNDDGLSDFAAFGDDTTNGDGEWWVAISDGMGGHVVQQWADGQMPELSWREFFVGDFNDDGIDDIIGFSKGFFNDPFDPSQGFVPGQWWVFTADPNAEEFSTSGTPWADDWAIAGVWESFFVGDFNGDGLDDAGGYSIGLYGEDSAQIYIAINNGNGSDPTLAWASDLPNRREVDAVLVGNFDDNMHDDIAIFREDGPGDESFDPSIPDAGWLVARSNGTDAFTVEVWSDIWSIPRTWAVLTVGDFNNDGVDDVFGYARVTRQGEVIGTLHVGVSELTGQNSDRRFASLEWEADLPDPFFPRFRNRTVVADFNDDGIDDLAHLFRDGLVLVSERVADGDFDTNIWGELGTGGLDEFFAVELDL